MLLKRFANNTSSWSTFWRADGLSNTYNRIVSIEQNQDTTNMQNNFFWQRVMQHNRMISKIISFWSICVYKGYGNNHFFKFYDTIWFIMIHYNFLQCTFYFYYTNISVSNKFVKIIIYWWVTSNFNQLFFVCRYIPQIIRHVEISLMHEAQLYNAYIYQYKI